MANRKERNYTEGSVIGSLLRLTGPIVAANILQTAYQLIDTFWLGRLGANAVAAASISFPILFLIISLGGGLTLAGSVLVAQYKGRQDQRMVDYSSAQTFYVMFFVSVFLSVIGAVFAEPLMRLIGTGADIFEDTVAYFQVSAYGFVFLFMFFIFQSLMRGVGNVMLPTYIVLSTVFLNLLLDPLFIYGWGPIQGNGVAGAAYASIITQGLSALAGVIILAKGHYGIKVNRKDLKFDLKWFRELIRLGVPASIEQSTRALGMTLMTVLVTSFGSEVVASYGIGSRILSFVIIPALGLAISTTTLVGQNVGAGKLDRAHEVGMLSGKLGFFGLTGVGLLMFVFAEELTAFFVPGDDYVIKNGAMFIRIMAPSFGLLGVQQVMNGVFNGAGFTTASMLISILSLWIIRFPLAYVLSHNTELSFDGIWWSFPLSNLIAAAVAFIWFRSGHWKKRISLDEQPLNTTS